MKCFPALAFTELRLQIVFWIYEFAIHSRRFIYYQSFLKSILFLFDGELGCF
jgi:hypothetical protein